MCPYTLDHNKMLASTMQHSTHNHTQIPTPSPRTQTLALEQQNPERTREQHPHRMSSQDPTVCQARQRPPESNQHRSNHAAEVFHPATPTPPPANQPTRCLIRRGISERRLSPPAGPAETRPTLGSSTPSTRWLLRKEVIQPHLPVRLPCYDFVPIASPTFDDSLRPMNQHWAG